MSGYSEQELISLHSFDLDCIESSDDVKRRIESIKLKGEERFESRHRRKDGTLFDVEVSVQYRPEQGGQFICFSGILQKTKKPRRKRKNFRPSSFRPIRWNPLAAWPAVWPMTSTIC